MKTPSGAPEAPAAPCTRWSLADFSRSSYHFKEQGGRGSHGEGIPAGPSGSPPPLFPALLPAPPRASSEALQRPPPSAARGGGAGQWGSLRTQGRRKKGNVVPGSPWGQVVGSLPSPHYPHSSPQSPASQVLGASPPALPAPGDPALGSGEHPQMVRSACPLCRTPRQGTDGEQAAGGGGAAPTSSAASIVSGPPSWPGASPGQVSRPHHGPAVRQGR